MRSHGENIGAYRELLDISMQYLGYCICIMEWVCGSWLENR